MRYQFKKIYSWVLVLIMAISTIQSAIAIDFGQESQGKECQVTHISLSDANGMEAVGNCPAQEDEDKHADAECTMPCNFSSLLAPLITTLATRVEFRQKILTGSDPVLSHHSDLLKRPPKA